MTAHARFRRLARRTGQVFAAALLAGSVGSVQARNSGDPAVNGDVLVKLRTGNALAPLLVKYRLSLIDRFGSRPIFRLKVASSTTVADTIAALGREPDVLIAEPNALHRSPEGRKNNVWAIGDPDAYATQWAPEAMRLAEAHAITTGSGVRVAVLDTGVDRSHPLFAGRLLPGFDFVDFDSAPDEVGSPANLGFGHGTHVAGLVLLAAPAAKIMPLRVLDAQGQGNAWVLLEAMLHAVDPDGNPQTDDGAQVINLSLGSLDRTQLFDAISQLVSCTVPDPAEPGVDFTDPGYNGDKQRCGSSAGAVVVAAAGNDASKSVRQYPAAESAYGKIAVTASAADHRLASFSNFGSWVDVAAPGDKLTSSVPGGNYGTWSGTSMAAPLVAGTAALVRSIAPALSAKDVARRIIGTTSMLCGTPLRQVDAAAALSGTASAAGSCP